MQSRCVRLGVGISLNFCCSLSLFPFFLSHLWWLCAPFVSCLQLCWLRWRTSVSRPAGCWCPSFPTICLPSVPSYLLLVPFFLLLAFCGLFSWVCLPDYLIACLFVVAWLVGIYFHLLTYCHLPFGIFVTPDNHLPCLHTFCLGVKAMTTLVSRPWRSRIFYVCTAKPWNGHSTSWCARPVVSIVGMWKPPWKPMTWCPGRNIQSQWGMAWCWM